MRDAIFLVYAHTIDFFSPHVSRGKVVYYNHISARTGICNRVVELFTRHLCVDCIHEYVGCAPTSAISHYTGRLIGDSTVCAVTIAEQGWIQCRVGALGFKEKVMQLFSQALSVRYRCVTFVVWETCQMGVLLGPYLVYCVLKKFWYVCRSLHCMRCSLVLLGITGAHRYNFFLCVLVMPSSSKTVVPVV